MGLLIMSDALILCFIVCSRKREALCNMKFTCAGGNA